jgi:hypothetical protein
MADVGFAAQQAYDIALKRAQDLRADPTAASSQQTPAQRDALQTLSVATQKVYEVQRLVGVSAAQAGGGGSTASAVETGPDAETVARRNSVSAAIKGQFNAWGLGSLSDLILKYAQQDYSGEAIAFLLRDTQEYKNRFPAMSALAAKGRAISEAEYINYEQNASALESRYGLPKGMLLNNVTTLLTGEVSALELQDRATMAAADSITAPEDFKKQMKDYYGIDAGGLTAYYLDPSVAMPLLEKQTAIAQIGVEAARQGVNTGIGMASELQGQGVSQDQAKQGFGIVKSQEGFQTGAGEVTTQESLTKGVFGNAEEAKKTARIAASRTGRFEGGGSFITEKGFSGLGSATTA